MAGYVPSMYKALAKTPAAHEKKKKTMERRKRKERKEGKAKRS